MPAGTVTTGTESLPAASRSGPDDVTQTLVHPLSPRDAYTERMSSSEPSYDIRTASVSSSTQPGTLLSLYEGTCLLENRSAWADTMSGAVVLKPNEKKHTLPVFGTGKPRSISRE